MDTKKVLWALLVLFIVCGFFCSDIVAQEKKPVKDSKATEKRDRVEILIEQLKDKDRNVRISAIRSLAETKDPRAVEPLISLLKDKDAEIRWKSAVALGEQFKDVRAVEPLIVALKDEDKSVRENAAGSLGKINDPRAIPHLIEALKDRHPDVRRNVAIVLGWMQDARAVAPLIAALKDSDAGVREKAEEAIKRITNKTVDCDGYNEAVLSEEIKEKITGYFFTGKMGKNINFQMNLHMVLPDGPDARYPFAAYPYFAYGKTLQEGGIPLRGDYRYDGRDSSLMLSGTIKKDGAFELIEEVEIGDGHPRKAGDYKKTGRFEGKFSKDFKAASGTWISADGKRSYDFTLTRQAVYKTILADQTRVTSHQELEDGPGWDRETYTARFTYTYPIFDSSELAEINKSWATDAKNKTEGFLICSGDGHFRGYRFGGSIEVTVTLFSPQLISLSIEDTDFQDPTHGVGRTTYSVYSGLIYGKSKTGDSFKEIGLADLLGKDCLRILDKVIYDTLKRTYKEELSYEDYLDKNYPKGRGLAISGFHGLDSGGVSFAMGGSGIGLPNAFGDAFAHIPYKSFSKCIPQNSPLRSVIK